MLNYTSLKKGFQENALEEKLMNFLENIKIEKESWPLRILVEQSKKGAGPSLQELGTVGRLLCG